jgi:hypothetical protein
VIGKHRRSKRWIQGGREPRCYQWQYHRRLRFENRILQNAILKYDSRRASFAAATSTTWVVLCVASWWPQPYLPASTHLKHIELFSYIASPAGERLRHFYAKSNSRRT